MRHQVLHVTRLTCIWRWKKPSKELPSVPLVIVSGTDVVNGPQEVKSMTSDVMNA